MKSHRILLLTGILLLIYPSHAAAQKDEQEPLVEIETLIDAAERGDVESQFALAEAYLEGRGISQENSKAMKWFRKAAEQGHAEAGFKLWRIYGDGRIVPRDKAEAAKWLRKAAEQGDAEAQFHLGLMYGYGEGVSGDKAEAAKWFCNAAEQTGAYVKFLLGMRFLHGNGVPRDKTEAIKWLRKAAEQGDPSAQFNLGSMYVQGDGISQDKAEAEKWLCMAAEQGTTSAQCMLGTLYGEGNGVPPDYVQAHKWLNLCFTAEKGEKQEAAAKFLNEISKKMKPSQIEDALKMVWEWKPVRMYETPSGSSGRIGRGGGMVNDIGPFVLGNEVSPPEILSKPVPFYTEEARKAHAEGLVLIQAVVRKDGSVDSFRVLRRLGYGLDESAIYRIAKRWRFKPGNRNGVPVDVIVNIEVMFRLY